MRKFLNVIGNIAIVAGLVMIVENWQIDFGFSIPVWIKFSTLGVGVVLKIPKWSQE